MRTGAVSIYARTHTRTFMGLLGLSVLEDKPGDHQSTSEQLLSGNTTHEV